MQGIKKFALNIPIDLHTKLVNVYRAAGYKSETAYILDALRKQLEKQTIKSTTPTTVQEQIVQMTEEIGHGREYLGRKIPLLRDVRVRVMQTKSLTN